MYDSYLLHERMDRYWQRVGRDSFQGRVVEYMYSNWSRTDWGQDRAKIYLQILEYMET